jgi:hypothetical protein
LYIDEKPHEKNVLSPFLVPNKASVFKTELLAQIAANKYLPSPFLPYFKEHILFYKSNK